MEQHIKTLLDEYAGAYKQVDDCFIGLDDDDCLLCIEDIERMQEIIKELEASIRKEVVEELLEELLTEARKTDYADRTEYDVAYDFIKRIPFVKGITLK